MRKEKYMFNLFILAMTLLSNEGLNAQSIHYSTLSGDCVDSKEETSEECQAQPHCCHGFSRHGWQNDQFAEEQFEDTGWPSRRDDELSDQLMR